MFILDHAKVDVGCRASNAYTKADAEHVHRSALDGPDISCFGIFQHLGTERDEGQIQHMIILAFRAGILTVTISE